MTLTRSQRRRWRLSFPNAGGPPISFANVGSFLVANTVNCSGCRCFASRYWGIAIGRVPFCAKLLEECSVEAPVLCQAIGELHLAGFRLAPSYWGITICSVLLCFRTLGTICAVLHCVKLLESSLEAHGWFVPSRPLFDHFFGELNKGLIILGSIQLRHPIRFLSR